MDSGSMAGMTYMNGIQFLGNNFSIEIFPFGIFFFDQFSLPLSSPPF